MKNVTVAIPNETYRNARLWCAHRGYSLSKYFAFFLQKLAEHYAVEQAQSLLAAQPNDPTLPSHANSGPSAPASPDHCSLTTDHCPLPPPPYDPSKNATVKL